MIWSGWTGTFGLSLIKQRNQFAFWSMEEIKCNLGLIFSTHVIIITWVTSHASRTGLQRGPNNQTNFPWHKTSVSCILRWTKENVFKTKYYFNFQRGIISVVIWPCVVFACILWLLVIWHHKYIYALIIYHYKAL